ncbi:3-isopropylmalate dehydratase small subunit [Paraburkholderia silvatlantica]|uniref:3-isopropylmalate dehydratase n=1 Tax=Paraburkholderia silvatlantica TaxID=321895 RepID=A0ABR6FXX5_9BURK|nr:3-isopropylmalate dehydratase small subunit [Paraburkholderia silvatlantica]MBB2931967.1 3-isopropylmalate/(R)-2-methylmalate dehydratase small subunit [Paraburkholderia silvatlantica]PVY24644.1 3-isopropylmalate/(R)-2-methylmalate dehydratase small subunit [Paraburkholderia silvatlantica]PXW31140.1 3-isopropylmalate/(R)-2-methylmalate dehydratase small subunit [Paraburkholderia silvatlantica]
MKPFSAVHGRAVVFQRPNIDTDVIIRIERLMNTPREALGRYAFEVLRYDANGELRSDCVFNDPQNHAAPVLIAGENFGCGSSREGAVWALESLGIRCVIAGSFGDIFYNNCLQNGLLPVRLGTDEIATLVDETDGGRAIAIDLRSQIVATAAGQKFHFDIDQLKRDALLAGLDDIASTLCHEAEIAAWQDSDRQHRAWVWHTSAR